MQMLENNQRLDCPEKCPQSVYEVMLRCWSWRYVHVCVYCVYDCNFNTLIAGVQHSRGDKFVTSIAST